LWQSPWRLPSKDWIQKMLEPELRIRVETTNHVSPTAHTCS